MPRNKPNTTSQSKKSKSNGQPAVLRSEVLTLSEAAAYLRVAESDVLELATRQELPGQRIGAEWRFLKSALADWLRRPTRKQRLMRHAGAIKDDPYFEEMVEQIYRQRGRPMIEDD